MTSLSDPSLPQPPQQPQPQQPQPQPPQPPREAERLAALLGYDILDTPPESAFDDFTLLASALCGVPISAVSLIDQSRQWFKSKIGLDVDQTPRQNAFCAHAIAQPGELLEVPDATQDARFAHNPLVTGAPQIRFYAGAPLVTPEGHALGALCVIDTQPRQLSSQQKEALSALSRQVVAQLELRQRNRELHRMVQERDAARQEFEQTHQQLKNANEEFGALIGAMPDAIFLLDADGRYLKVAPSHPELLAMPSAELEGRTLREVFAPEQAARFEDVLHRARRDGHAVHLEYEIQLGRVSRWFDGTAAPMRDGRVLWLARDITARKQIEQDLIAAITELKLAHQNLEARVRSRTQELAQSREALQQAMDALQLAHDELEVRVRDRTAELERSNRELEQFAYIASHDLQEPLRMISSYTQLLSRRYSGQFDTDADEFMGYIVDGVARMQRLIRDLLAYSRAGSRAPRRERIDTNEAVASAVWNLRAAIEESEAQVTHDDLPPICADASQMTQLLQNLIGNALKFRAPGTTPRVHIGVSHDEDGPSFFVRDNGIGLEAQHTERIFAIFGRLHTRDEYEGTGIGLAICKKIVEAHGGRIWVESESGPGATFCWNVAPCEEGE